MDTKSLKEYIFDNNKIDYVLDKIGNKDIKFHPNKNYYSCSNFDGDNKTAVNVYNNAYLNVTNWTRQNDFDEMSDIITLTQYNKKCGFVEAFKYLHDILGLEYIPYKKKEHEKEIDVLGMFVEAREIGACANIIDVDDIHKIEEELVDDYTPLLHISWFHEGIMPWARKKFGIAYSYKRKRIVIPLRYWADGSLLGFNQRTTIENYDELDIKKYFITPSYQKNLNLYGLWENHDEIEKKGHLVICESEKSVLKRYSRNDGTCVALQGKRLSDEQQSIIRRLNISEVIIALDNDVSINEIRHMCEQLYQFKNVSYVKDRWNLLGKKDAPMDAPNKVYNYLIKHRVPYDESEHQKYLQSLNRK